MRCCMQGDFLGGALSIDKPIEERASPYLERQKPRGAHERADIFACFNDFIVHSSYGQ